MLDFLQNLQTEEHNFQEVFQTARHDRSLGIPVSTALTGIEVRLSDVVIIDNKTPKVFPFPGLANIYLLSLVVSDINDEPIAFELKGFEKVDDGDPLHVDKVLYYWKQEQEAEVPPSQIHIFSSIIKSKQKLRDVARLMEATKADPEYQTVIGLIGNVVSNVSAVTNISGLVLQVAGIIGKYLGNVDDKPLLTQFQSFTDIGGDFDGTGTLEKPASNRYASMKLTITVRDKDRAKDS